MNGKEIFRIWAPLNAKWTDWVRPVPFVAIDREKCLNKVVSFDIPNIEYIKEIKKDTALVIDLPGNDGIKEGIALAKIGYRPIPVYNGTVEQEGSLAAVDNRDIELGLIKGAKELQEIVIDKDAPPAFLLDTNRMNRYKMNVSVFDNSWDLYAQDIPSAEYFLKNGINKIIIRADSLKSDLNKIFYKFSKKGIKIFITDGFDEMKEVKLKQPREKEID